MSEKWCSIPHRQGFILKKDKSKLIRRSNNKTQCIINISGYSPYESTQKHIGPKMALGFFCLEFTFVLCNKFTDTLSKTKKE